MRRHSFLDETALKYGCFISELTLDPELRRAAVYDLLHVEPGQYPPGQWEEAACYLTGSIQPFQTAEELRRFFEMLERGDLYRKDTGNQSGKGNGTDGTGRNAPFVS